MSESISVPQYDVIVIGAGIAGLSAAQVFSEALKNGQEGSNYLVLEGSDRVGGRCKSGKLGDATIELGAQWSHGSTRKNPLQQIVQEVGMEYVPSDDEDESFRDCISGAVWDAEESDEYDDFYEAYEDVEVALDKKFGSRAKRAKFPDESYVEAFAEQGWAGKTPFDEALLWTVVEWEWGASASKVSTKQVTRELEETRIGDDDRHIVDPRGFDYMARYIYDTLEKERFKTGEVVSSVIVSEDGLQVNVKTANGATYTSKQVLVTASIGVLQADKITFDPPFPSPKRTAINQIQMAQYVKVTAQWNTRWWDDSTISTFHTILVDNTSPFKVMSLVGGKYDAAKASESKNKESQYRTLCFTATGDDGLTIQRMSDRQVRQELTSLLNRAYPSLDIPAPDDIFVPRWKDDPLTLGAFSYWPEDAVRTEDLTSPYGRADKNSIWFAGEAMHVYTGYLHSAYYSGRDTAQSMLSSAIHSKLSLITFFVASYTLW